MAVTRRIFVAILLTFLFALTYISYRKTLSEPTAFEEAEVEHQAIFPSFTICPRLDGVMDNFTNFKDVMAALEDFKLNGFDAKFQTAGKGVEKLEYDLKNASILASKFNATFDEVWHYAAIVQSYCDKCITLCVTINVPQVDQPRQGEHVIFIATSINSPGAFYYERHEHGNSKQNYDFDTTSGFNMLGNFKLSVEMLKETDTTFLKKSTYDCYEDNSIRMTNCMNEFYAKELGCKLPWDTESKLDDQWKNCETAKELDTFRNLSHYITSKTLTSKVEKYGCLKPNCRKITWKKAEHTEVYDQPGQPGHKLVVVMPHNAKVLQRQEVKLADMGSFVADCGSYLGLFVGASILSLTDILIYTIKRLRKFFK